MPTQVSAPLEEDCRVNPVLDQLPLFGGQAPSPTLARKLKKQRDIIRRCKKTKEPLASALARVGWTYDDLQYERNVRPIVENARCFVLDDFRARANSIPVVSFFSGAGGLDLGFEAAGFTHAALVEHNPLFCSTLRHNKPEWTVIGPPEGNGDVSRTEAVATDLRRIIGRAPFQGIFVGGPPCQPFSIAANQRFKKSGKNFKRVGFAHEMNGNLLFDFIELIKLFRPAAFLIENVTGLLEVDGGEQVNNAYGELEGSGYDVREPTVLIASEHNVPQNRSRLFIAGNRRGRRCALPTPTGHQLSCGPVFMNKVEGVLNHVTREHSAESIERYMRLDYGQRDQLGRVDRLDPMVPSKTVIAGGANGGGRSHLHPFVPRTLSVRESARLQTFPDKYEFLGPSARQFTQVGNAVPPVLAAQIAASLYESVFARRK
jgi:DNA (cytosine-5)-methyltransferase 1